MNLDKLEGKLLAAARVNVPSDQVPYAFEKRIMARLKSEPALDWSGLWAHALWRAAAPCVGIMLLLAAWSVLAPASKPSATDVSQEFENTVLAAADQETPADPL